MGKPGFVVMKGGLFEGFELALEGFRVSPAGDAFLLECFLDAFLPLAPWFHEKEETAGCSRVVRHISGRFGDYPIGPREHPRNEFLIGVHNVVSPKDAVGGGLIKLVSDGDLVGVCKEPEHGGEVLVGSGITDQLNSWWCGGEVGEELV